MKLLIHHGVNCK